MRIISLPQRIRPLITAIRQVIRPVQIPLVERAPITRRIPYLPTAAPDPTAVPAQVPLAERERLVLRILPIPRRIIPVFLRLRSEGRAPRARERTWALSAALRA